MARRRRKLLQPIGSALLITGAAAGVAAGGFFSQTPDLTQAVKLGAAGGLIGVSIGAITYALLRKSSTFGVAGGVGLLLGGFLASNTREEILSGGAGLSGLSPAISYYAPLPG